MEVIAKTNGAFLIQATESEIKQILNAVNGVMPPTVEIGQKMPAIDYAATITKVKTLGQSQVIRDLVSSQERLKRELDWMVDALKRATEIEL
jgi:hypothetical protein